MTLALIGHAGPAVGDDVGPSEVTVPLPSGVEPGDWCFLHFAGRANTTGFTTLSADPGWLPISETQEEADFVSGTVRIVNQVWQTVLNDADIALGDVTVEYEDAFSGGQHPYLAVVAVRPLTYYSGFTTQGHGPSGTAPMDPLPTVPSFVFSAKATVGGASGTTADNGFDEIYAAASGGGAPLSIAMRYKLVGPGAGTMLEWAGNSAFHAWALAVEPTPAPGGWRLGKLGLGPRRGGFS